MIYLLDKHNTLVVWHDLKSWAYKHGSAPDIWLLFFKNDYCCSTTHQSVIIIKGNMICSCVVENGIVEKGIAINTPMYDYMMHP